MFSSIAKKFVTESAVGFLTKGATHFDKRFERGANLSPIRIPELRLGDDNKATVHLYTNFDSFVGRKIYFNFVLQNNNKITEI